MMVDIKYRPPQSVQYVFAKTETAANYTVPRFKKRLSGAREERGGGRAALVYPRGILNNQFKKPGYNTRMRTLVDIHNHLDLLPGVIRFFNSRIYHHRNSSEYLLRTARRRGLRLIVSTALYAVPGMGEPLEQIKKQIRKIEKWISLNPDAKLIKTAQDLDSPFTMGLVLHLESARWIKGRAGLLDRLHNLGIRGVIPVHFVTNWFGGSGEDPRPAHGLTEKGRAFLDEMARRKIWLDISHLDDRTTTEALNYFSGDIIASHTGLQKFRPLRRNLSGDNLKLLLRKGGCLGLIAWSHLTGKTPEDYKEQIRFLLTRGFENNLVVGTDFGSPINTPAFLKSFFDYADFIESNYPEVAPKILSGNALTFLQKSLPARGL
jgi:microsomal dipeptidase-like Zn-dependent dipeptidase